MTTIIPPPATRNIGAVNVGGKSSTVVIDSIWYRYLTQALFDRLGGVNAPSLLELEALIVLAQAAADAAQADATDAQTRIGDVETELDVVSEILQTVYVPQWDQVDPTTAYFGQALPGIATSAAAWRIIRYTFAGDDFSGQYADGDALFNNVWDDRASLSYS